MAYELTIACGVALAAVLIGRYLTRGADSLVARVVRRALWFLAPLFLVALLFSLHHYWLGATADIVRTGTTIGQLEGAIAKVQFPPLLHSALQGQNALALATVLFVLAALLFVRPGTPHLGIVKGATAGVGVLYVVVTMIVSGALLGHTAVRGIDARVERLKAQVDDIERKTTVYKSEVEDAARQIVKEALIEALDVTSIQAQLDAVRASLRAAQEELEPYRYLFQSAERPFGSDSLESDFADTWRGIQNAIIEMHWDRKPARAAVPDAGRSAWSTLRLYEASTDLRNYKLSRSKEELSELHDTLAKTFDVVYAAAGKTDFAATLEIGHGYPLAPLVVSLVDVWYEPLKALSATQAETLFHATVVERKPFADVAATALTQAREAMTPLKADLQPGLEQVARGLQRLEGEAARLPQSFRRLAERTYPERLQTFRSNWHRVLSFSTPAAARAATALREQTEALLDAPADPFEKHEQLNAYEQTLQTLAGRVDENSRYQALLLFEQQLLDGQPGTRAFARFTKEHVESRLAAQPDAENGGLAEGESLAELEVRSQWLETHRLAAAGLLDDADTAWEPGERERILNHLALDLQFFTRAIRERYKPETYTTDELRKRIRRYSKLASALEPENLQGGEFIDSMSGNLTGRSAKGALRFEIVYLVARAEARLRLSPSKASLQLADILRQERDLIAVYQNGSEDSYVKALFDLWQEADLQPELGAEVSETVVDSIEDDSKRLQVPAVGAVRALRRLVQQSKDKAREVTRLRRELAALETSDAALNRALTVSHGQFAWLQEQIRRDWAKTRRQLHISAAYRSR
jgi:hypothetical protein